MGALTATDRHNERKNENYSNKDIDATRTKDNYHLIEPQRGYKTEFDKIRQQNNLKGNLRLTGEKQSNVACEFLITSDNEFFKTLGAERTKEFFTDSLEFVKNKVGEENIISAVVHLDETTPHMHVTYIPVVEKTNTKGVTSKRINCSEFWKGFNSYGILQDDYYKHCIEKGYQLERGEIGSRAEHLTVAKLKANTAIKEYQAIENKANTLKSEIKAISAKLEGIQGVELSVSHINALAPQKTLTGTIKGITLEDIENLKLTAIKGAEYRNYETKYLDLYQKAKTAYSKLKNQKDDAENRNVNICKENFALKMQNSDLEIALEKSQQKNKNTISAINKTLKLFDNKISDFFVKNFNEFYQAEQHQSLENYQGFER